MTELFFAFRDDITPWEFQGTAGVYSASVMGYGISDIVLGNTFLRPLEDGDQRTVEIGAAVSFVSSTLIDYSYSSCGCEQ